MNALVGHGVLSLTPKQNRVLHSVNVSKLPRKKKPLPGHPSQPRKELALRFHFDSVDTLRYWYEPASGIFADVSTNEVALVAERWILDRWKESAEVWRWADEPRKWRYPERDWHLWANDHGSMPTIERYNTYLEWHAMCCAVGELLNTRHLALTESFDFDRFENWLARYQLAYPPRWLADLRGPKPPEIRMWLPPTQTEAATWLNTPGSRLPN